MGIYYICKFNDNLKFGLGVKSINSIENFLNLTIEKKTPYHIKARIDSKLNLSATVRKQFNDKLALAYGIGASNPFQKRFRIQTGMVLEYNAWFPSLLILIIPYLIYFLLHPFLYQ